VANKILLSYSVTFVMNQFCLLKNTAYSNIRLIFALTAMCILAACGTPKDTAMSRGMQNLTARYNYIYNSNLILDNYEEQLYETYKDNYNEILPVYTVPEKFSFSTVANVPVNERDLDKIITKARAIVEDKAFSNYIDEAYILMGRAQYYKTNYFVAEEYFDYTAKTYIENPNIRISALNWKARSLMQLDNLKDAALILDTVYRDLPDIKGHKAEPLATIAQMYIYQGRYTDAIQLLTSAVKATPLKRNRIRWTYILAQLYEQQKDYKEALSQYLRVQKSNAAFELYFNANLNRIRLTGLLNGERLNRKKQLNALLKDDKNLDYIDQIYYHIAQSYADDNDFTGAEKYYKLSVRNSSRNSYQKGLSYLRLADLNFKEFRNFLKAKDYYDSTVTTLPKSYPGYEQILKKSDNLEYISKRYEAIAFQDTLQMLAKLPETERLARIKQITLQAKPAATDNGTFREDPFAGANQAVTSPGSPALNSASTFYFSNTAALSRGSSDFTTRWGNRKLEDDWRQSLKSSSQASTESIVKVENGTQPPAGADGSGNTADTSSSRYLSALPLTATQMTASNQQIIDAYYEMANFYQQELEDQAEALRIYQLILSRFPENNRLASIYYSLYLGYKDSNAASSEKYKKLVLDQYPSSAYAKTILDPRYSVKQSELEARVLAVYNEIFGQYERKAFPQVITSVNSTIAQYPNSMVNPQLSYLKAIAIGRTQPVDSLVASFNEITNVYPLDKVIVPLVRSHLTYIAAHRDEFSKRKVALPDFDTNEPQFFVSEPLPSQPQPQQALPSPESPKPEVKTAEVIVKEDKPVPAVPEVGRPIFSTEESAIYYYVIDVEDASLRLSSSRFGIGQFNRGNYGDAGLRHQLTEFDNDQLIYVGNFSSFAEAKSYADGITPQLKQIMKVPAGIYSSFIISKENFEKLQSKDLVTKYLDFYNNTYKK
jgi:tetratricopeptide (TPR) repeat protein